MSALRIGMSDLSIANNMPSIRSTERDRYETLWLQTWTPSAPRPHVSGRCCGM